MAISREITVWCDHCLNWTRHSGNATTARAEAKKQGWERRREGRFLADVCPDCLALKDIERALEKTAGKEQK